MKAAVELRKRDFKDVRTTCTPGGNKEYNIEVGFAVHQAATEFQKGTYFKEDAALMQGSQVDTGRIVPRRKVLFENKRLVEFALYSFKSTAVAVAEGNQTA